MSSTFLQTRQQVGDLAHTAWRKPWSVWICASCKSAPHAAGAQDTAVTLLCRVSVLSFPASLGSVPGLRRGGGSWAWLTAAHFSIFCYTTNAQGKTEVRVALKRRKLLSCSAPALARGGAAPAAKRRHELEISVGRDPNVLTSSLRGGTGGPRCRAGLGNSELQTARL